MEHTGCIFCEKDDSELLFRKKDKLGISDDEFQIRRCRGCGLIYISPRPGRDEIGRFYPEYYSWKQEEESPGAVGRLEKFYRYQLLGHEVGRVIARTGLENGKVLDVGCGSGDRLDVFRKRGFDSYGVEVSASAEHARGKMGLDVVRSDLAGACFPDGFFDIVTLYNVLEHLHDPREALKEINRITKPGGYLVVQVPNTGSLQFKIFGKRWAAIEPPRDLFYFRTGLVRMMLSEEGFGVVSVDGSFHWFHPPTFTITAFPGLDPQLAWKKQHQGSGAMVSKLLWAAMTLTVSPVFAAVENALKRPAVITVYARKKE